MKESKFDLSRFLELLKIVNFLKINDNKLYKNEIFYEYVSYLASITDQIFYKNRKEYFSLIYLYLTNKIEIDLFIIQFHKNYKADIKLTNETIENYQKLANFFIHQDAPLIQSQLSLVSDFCFDYEYNQISEQDFRREIKWIFNDMDFSA